MKHPDPRVAVRVPGGQGQARSDVRAPCKRRPPWISERGLGRLHMSFFPRHSSQASWARCAADRHTRCHGSWPSKPSWVWSWSVHQPGSMTQPESANWSRGRSWAGRSPSRFTDSGSYGRKEHRRAASKRRLLIVRRGAYRYIRHPLYLSLILFAIGAYLKSPAWLSTCLLGVAVGSLWVTSRVEERENLSRFGESYRDYMRSTKGLVPFLF